MTYDEAMLVKRTLETRLEGASRRIKEIPGIGSGIMGLTPDHVRKTREYQDASAEYEAAHATLRKFNAAFLKAFKKEYRQDRDNRRLARTVAAT
jgi:hypothetical protein